MRRNAVTFGGCALSLVGALTAPLLWLDTDRTRIHLGRGFEGEGTDYIVLLTELPLVVLTGAALPLLACALLNRLLDGRRDRASDRHR
ncbi:hypothetical protein K4B79_35645 [Streptomyces lincolnensis]|uniref:hypothetical protein n=1 Tax=Streptomyces lincolnensis TaxID=1915 RepID=UPI001E60780F|nr:hypothetical protein [Streptomyces lincolnensis]MCD7443533.1 hypothetical protein [Streptomyces lincolnensis]